MIMPISAASFPVKRLPVINRSVALAGPTRLVKRTELPISGASPIEEKAKDIFVFSSAIAKSHAMARLIPPPAQAPSIQATTGFSIWRI